MITNLFGHFTTLTETIFMKYIQLLMLGCLSFTQELYAAFLNSLPKSLRDGHAKLLQSPGYYQLRGTIKKDSSRYLADIKDAPLNFIAWSNALSLADWCGLRPVTDLEFSKACRGTKTQLQRNTPGAGHQNILLKGPLLKMGSLILWEALMKKI